MFQHPVRTKTTYCSSEEAERYVNLIATSAIPVVLTSAKVIDAVKSDQTLLNLADTIRNNKWKHVTKSADNQLKPFIPVRDELTVTKNELILKSNKIVMPLSLKNRAIVSAHAGYEGIC